MSNENTAPQLDLDALESAVHMRTRAEVASETARKNRGLGSADYDHWQAEIKKWQAVINRIEALAESENE